MNLCNEIQQSYRAGILSAKHSIFLTKIPEREYYNTAKFKGTIDPPNVKSGARYLVAVPFRIEILVQVQ